MIRSLEKVPWDTAFVFDEIDEILDTLEKVNILNNVLNQHIPIKEKRVKRQSEPAWMIRMSTCIRPVIEYACQAFHDSLPKYLSDKLERLQKRAFRIIFPDQHYKEALRNTNTPSLYDRKQELTTKYLRT